MRVKDPRLYAVDDRLSNFHRRIEPFGELPPMFAETLNSALYQIFRTPMTYRIKTHSEVAIRPRKRKAKKPQLPQFKVELVCSSCTTILTLTNERNPLSLNGATCPFCHKPFSMGNSTGMDLTQESACPPPAQRVRSSVHVLPCHRVWVQTPLRL